MALAALAEDINAYDVIDSQEGAPLTEMQLTQQQQQHKVSITIRNEDKIQDNGFDPDQICCVCQKQNDRNSIQCPRCASCQHKSCIFKWLAQIDSDTRPSEYKCMICKSCCNFSNVKAFKMSESAQQPSSSDQIAQDCLGKPSKIDDPQVRNEMLAKENEENQQLIVNISFHNGNHYNALVPLAEEESASSGQRADSSSKENTSNVQAPSSQDITANVQSSNETKTKAKKRIKKQNANPQTNLKR